MDRTIISFNVPNIITVNVMAWLGFLTLVVLFQLVAGKRMPSVGPAKADSNIPDISIAGV